MLFDDNWTNKIKVLQHLKHWESFCFSVERTIFAMNNILFMHYVEMITTWNITKLCYFSPIIACFGHISWNSMKTMDTTSIFMNFHGKCIPKMEDTCTVPIYLYYTSLHIRRKHCKASKVSSKCWAKERGENEKSGMMMPLTYHMNQLYHCC